MHEPIDVDNGVEYDGYEHWTECLCGWPTRGQWKDDSNWNNSATEWWKHYLATRSEQHCAGCGGWVSLMGGHDGYECPGI